MSSTNAASAPAARPAHHAPLQVAVRILRIVTLLMKRAFLDDVTTMAAGLAYKTLLGLIPILVVVTLVAKTLMGARFGPFVAGFIHTLGLDAMRIVPPTDGTPAGEPVALGGWIEALVNQAASIDLSALGWVGVVVTVASAIWLMFSIELSFNRIYRSHRTRNWLRRVMLYWFVLTATPLLIAAIPLLSAILDDAEHVQALHWVVAVGRTLWGVLILWMLLFLVYMVVPAAKVRASSAAFGAFLAAGAIIALKGFLSAYFEYAFAMSKLYGSLGLVPVFMFWLYVVWFAVLGGLEISSIAQTVGIRGLAAGDAADDARFADPLLLVAVMECACAQWAAGRPVTPASVSVERSIDDRLAGELLVELASAGLLVRSDGDAFVPARPPAELRAEDVLAVARKRSAGDAAIAHSGLATGLRAALDAAAANATMGPAATRR